MEITEFIAARLDEDEAAARAATPGPWVAETYIDDAEPVGVEYLVSAPDEAHIVVGAGLGHDQAEAETVHIARHDPARVLREVAAKREILVVHARLNDSPWCQTCDPGADPFGDSHASYPCRTVCLLAAAWSDHPDYLPEWAVAAA